MDEYISRHDALLYSEIIRVYSKDYGNIDVVPVEYLADIPAADVQPVKHGHWIKSDTQRHVEVTYECSECQHEAVGEYEKTPFCGGCGARMDGDSE